MRARARTRGRGRGGFKAEAEAESGGKAVKREAFKSAVGCARVRARLSGW